jgi:large subunit ribosomal protein L5
MFLDHNNKKIENFHNHYKATVIQELISLFSYSNPHQVPKLQKVVVNMGVGEAVSDAKVIKNAFNDLQSIVGQKPVITKAKKSIARFKLREGMSLGCKVTLRGHAMYHFLERLVFIALPRMREFKGFSSKSFDGMGNLNFGVTEQIIFPEIDYDKIDQLRGMNITIVTSTKNNLEAKALLEAFYFPFFN